MGLWLYLYILNRASCWILLLIAARDLHHVLKFSSFYHTDCSYTFSYVYEMLCITQRCAFIGFYSKDFIMQTKYSKQATYWHHGTDWKSRSLSLHCFEPFTCETAKNLLVCRLNCNFFELIKVLLEWKYICVIQFIFYFERLLK